MIEAQFFFRAIGVVEDRLDWLARGEFAQSHDADAVVFLNPVVVCRIAEGEGEKALLLQVSLVDPGEAAGDDRGPVEQPWRQGGVFA